MCIMWFWKIYFFQYKCNDVCPNYIYPENKGFESYCGIAPICTMMKIVLMNVQLYIRKI